MLLLGRLSAQRDWTINFSYSFYIFVFVQVMHTMRLMVTVRIIRMANRGVTVEILDPVVRTLANAKVIGLSEINGPVIGG